MSDVSKDRLDEIERRLNEIENVLRSIEDKLLKLFATEEDKVKEESSVIEGMVSQFIPGLGGVIKALEYASPEFKKRIAQTDAEVRHRIEVGWSSRPVIEYGVSVRPLNIMPSTARSPSKPAEFRIARAMRREPIIDVMDEGEYITIVAEIPEVENNISLDLREGVLEIRAGDFKKYINLPPDAKNIVNKSFKNGILQLRISRT